MITNETGICDLCRKIVFEYERFRIREKGKWKDLDICPECGRRIVEEQERKNEHL